MRKTIQAVKAALIAQLLLLLFAGSQGQSTPIADIMNRIYRNYDTSQLIRFDVRYHYQSDTISGQWKTDELKGSYTMSRGRIRFRLGETEYLQNDSLLIAVFHKEQMIVINRPQSTGSGQFLPLRQQLDSLLRSQSSRYSVRLEEPPSDTVSTITFNGNDSLSSLQSFSMQFHRAQGLITRIRSRFTDYLPASPPGRPDESGEEEHSPAVVRRNISLDIEFSHYSLSPAGMPGFSENEFIWFEDGRYRAAAAFREYQVYDSRFGW